MSRIVRNSTDVPLDEVRSREECAACKSKTAPRSTTKIEGIVMNLCIDWSACIARSVLASVPVIPNHQNFLKDYGYGR